MLLSVNGIQCGKIHFTGILGSGMSAVAQYLRWQGVSISGSDRLINNQDTLSVRTKLEQIGCTIFPQDGSGIDKDTDAVCVSTAIEEDNADIISARALSIPIFHRSDLLAAIISTKKAVAVAGTSGKSTVTAMIFEFLTHCGKSPSLISGAGLRRLENDGYIGNAFAGQSDILIFEADESDGTIVKYFPSISIFLNVSKDHKTVPEVLTMFQQLALQSKWTASNGDDLNFSHFDTTIKFSLGKNAQYGPQEVISDKMSFTILKDGVHFRLPLPGVHNASNCIAAICVCQHLGCDPLQLSKAVADYKGVARRFSVMSTNQGVIVVDDFAHNPEKIKAAILAARGLSTRLAIIYQPHGFGPTRFLKEEYASVFKSVIRSVDTLYLLPIYYAGGTAIKDISSEDILKLIGQSSFEKHVPQNRDELLLMLRKDVKTGDCALLMGARDPSLSSFAIKIADLFGGITL